MSSYDEVVAKDLELLWSIQEFCYRTPWLNDRMMKIISKNPLRDIVSILWIFFIVGIVELKEKHFWVVSMNLTVSFSKYYRVVFEKYVFLTSLYRYFISCAVPN